MEKFAKLHKECIIRAQSAEEELSQHSLERKFPLPSSAVGTLVQANALIAQEEWEDLKVQKPCRVEYETRKGQYVK